MTMMRHLLYPVPSDACDIRIATAVFPFPRMPSIRSRWNASKDKKAGGGVVWTIMTEVVAVVCLERREESDDEHQ